jgi:hypothetical protein
MKKINISEYVGKKFGRLTILKEGSSVKYNKTTMRKVVCRCDCGTEKEVDFNSVKGGKSTSCGCFNKEHAKKIHTKHGMAMLETGVRHPDYCIWMKMKSRCFNINDKSYKNYGGRGITVCDKWKDSFQCFIEDMGWRPNKNYSIERIDYDGNYCPDNCKWIHKSEQSRNTRRVKLIYYNGNSYCLTELCKLLNLPYSTMRHRVYDLKLPFAEAMKYPQHYKFKIK